MTARSRETVFLTNFIFNPTEVDLPPGFDEVLLRLNIWPKHIAGIEQKRAIIAQEEFTIRGTTFYRNKPNLRSSGNMAFRYAQGNKVLVLSSEYDHDTY